jgi:hypothetical protein
MINEAVLGKDEYDNDIGKSARGCERLHNNVFCDEKE